MNIIDKTGLGKNQKLLFKVKSTVHKRKHETKSKKKLLLQKPLSLPLMGETGSFEKALTMVFLPWTNNGGGKLATIEAMSSRTKIKYIYMKQCQNGFFFFFSFYKE